MRTPPPSVVKASSDSPPSKSHTPTNSSPGASSDQSYRPPCRRRAKASSSKPSKDDSSLKGKFKREIPPEAATNFSEWIKTFPDEDYHLPHEPKRRQHEEQLWLKYLLEYPKMWLGSEADKRAQAQMETVSVRSSPSLAKRELTLISTYSQFARSISALYQKRCRPPTLEYLYNTLLPSWARPELDDTDSTFAVLDALADVDDDEVSEGVKEEHLGRS